MSGKTDKNQILGAIQDTLNEVQEILAKSGYGDMEKESPEQEASESEAQESPEQEAAEAQESPEQESSDQEAPEAASAEGEQDPAQALAEQAKQLTDEELDHMIEALMSEKETRHSAEAAPQEEQAPEAVAPQAEDEAQKSMKSEFASLAKSTAAMTDAIGKLSKEVAELKAAKPAASKVTSRPAVTSKQQVLEKSAPVKQRLSKSDTLTFLEGEMRKRNPAVNSTLVAEVNLTKTESELAQIQDRLQIEGLNFPTK